MRAFVALEITAAEVLDSLVEAQVRLSRSGADLKLVERENIHFTVKFLGELSDPEVKRADSLLSRGPPQGADVEVRGMGAFPSAGNPSVVWAGVAPVDEPSVKKIAAYAIDALEGVGERDERPFRAHVTLARVRSKRRLQALSEEIAEEKDRPFGRTRLSALKLKASRLTPSGPVYADIGAYPLS